jgi:phosphorylcholine metabolism protein LicD
MESMMKKYYLESIINEIYKGIQNLVNKNIINKETKIILYGLDTYSFAMRTILSNLGYRVDCYILDDEDKVIGTERSIKSFASRYLNSKRDIIDVCIINERLIPYDSNAIILITSSNYSEIKGKLAELGYSENLNFYQLFDWDNDLFVESMRGNRELTLHDIQTINKDMLNLFDEYCRKNNFRYWVCGGTLLGTIRHKGFIPWDDDIDVFMPWNDYQRFISEYDKNSLYELIGPDITDRSDYYDIWSKIIDYKTMLREDGGFVRKIHPISLDIFPLVGMPADTAERHLFFANYMEMNKRIWEDFYANNGDFSVFNKWYLKQKEFLCRFDFDSSKYVGVLGTGYGEKDCTTCGVYSETIRMPFEDIEVNVPVGYKEYLDNLYGENWMELPKPEYRVSHHDMIGYWL